MSENVDYYSRETGRWRLRASGGNGSYFRLDLIAPWGGKEDLRVIEVTGDDPYAAFREVQQLRRELACLARAVWPDFLPASEPLT